jgi:hypothetical protein
MLSSVILEGNESCFRRAEHVSDIIDVFLIKVYMKTFLDSLRRYYCLLLKLGIAMQERIDNDSLLWIRNCTENKNKHFSNWICIPQDPVSTSDVAPNKAPTCVSWVEFGGQSMSHPCPLHLTYKDRFRLGGYGPGEGCALSWWNTTHSCPSPCTWGTVNCWNISREGAQLTGSSQKVKGHPFCKKRVFCPPEDQVRCGEPSGHAACKWTPTHRVSPSVATPCSVATPSVLADDVVPAGTGHKRITYFWRLSCIACWTRTNPRAITHTHTHTHPEGLGCLQHSESDKILPQFSLFAAELAPSCITSYSGASFGRTLQWFSYSCSYLLGQSEKHCESG